MPQPTLESTLEGRCLSAGKSFGMPVFEIERGELATVAALLRDAHGFDLLLDVTAVDHLGRTPRFELVVHLYSPALHQRVRLKAAVPEDDAVVPTLTTLYGSARFLEREAHEMFGIRFEGNADLRPILLYEGFVGHPLRKDYPMEREQPIVEYRTAP
jgi:NADH-quinone oxidoreductase subunit C